MKSLYRLQVLLDLADKMSGPLSAPIKRIQEFAGASDLADRSLERMRAGMALITVGAAIAAPLALATTQAIAFEEAFASARKVIDFPTPQGPKILQDSLISMSNTIPKTATELTQIAAEAGAAGIQFRDLATFTEDASKMSVAFDISAQASGESMAQLRNIFGLTQDGVRTLGDAVNQLDNTMAAKSVNILDVLRRVGGTASLVGITGQQVAAFGAAMLSTGRPAEVVATGLNAMIMRLSTASQQGTRFQQGLKSIGLSARGLEGAMRKDATGAILGFLNIVDKSKDKITVLQKLFGAEYADDIALLVGQLPAVKTALTEVGDATVYAGSMQKEFDSRANTTANKLELLRNRFGNVSLTIGQQLLPVLRPLIDRGLALLGWVFKMVNTNPQLVQSFLRVAIAMAALPIGIGVVILGLSAIGTAAGQARVGLAFLKLMVSTTQLAFRNGWAAVTGFANRLVIMGATARGVSANLLLMNGATGFQQLRFALIGVQVGLMNAARAAVTFTVALLTNPIFLAIAAIIALAAAFYWAWQNVEVFRNNVLAALEPIRQAWTSLVDLVLVLADSFAPLGTWIAQAVGPGLSALDVLAYGVGFVLGFIFTLFVTVFAQIAAAVLTGVRGLILIFSGLVEFLVGVFTLDLDRARSGADKIAQGIKLIFGNAWAWLMVRTAQFRDWIVQTWHNLAVFFSKPIKIPGLNWQGIKDTLAAIWSWITTVAVPNMVQMGRDLMGGIVAGIKSAVGYVKEAVTVGATAASGAWAAATETKSPSRLFAYYGAMLMAGLGLGIIQNSGYVNNALVAAMPTPPALEAPYITRLPEISTSSPITRLAEFTAPPANEEVRDARAPVQSRSARQTAGISIVIQNITIQAAPNMSAEEFTKATERGVANAIALALESAAQEAQVRRAG